MRIYIAGSYTAPDLQSIEQNVNRAIDAGIELVEKGHTPYIPHLTHYVDLRGKETKKPLKWEDYIQWDLHWLELCDGLLFLGESRGVRIELEHAKKKGIKIFYDLKEIPLSEIKKYQF